MASIPREEHHPHPATKNHVSFLVKTTILSTFSLLTALTTRDVIIKTVEAVVPTETSASLVFIYFYASLVALITLLLAYMWGNTLSK